MAYYSDDLIEEVISQNDIVDVVSEYVSLKKSGRNFMGLCPFHREKTPSFVVSLDKQICKCFGCSKGGNVLQFIMKIENLEFIEALEFLANRAHIDMSKYVVKNSYNKSLEEAKDLKEVIYNINKCSAMYYHNNLIEKLKEESNTVKEYVSKRKLDMNTIVKFGLGYGAGKIPLYKYLAENGFTEDEMLASGIILKNENGRLYDRFFSRLIFPIFDVRDRVIAFGGRVLDNSLPKYLNSAENIVYYKGKHLYCMNFARKEKIDKIIIVEGYMDAISLQKAGFTNVVASLGTALTVDQARLIKKYTDNVIIAYDQDGAGQDATLRGLDILVDKGLNVKVLKLDKEDIKDPDEYVNKMGKERLQNCIDRSMSLIEFKVSKLEKNLDMNDIDSKIRFLNSVANILSKIDNNIERDIYVDKISEKYNIAKDPIIKEINKKLNLLTEQSSVSLNDISRKIAFNVDVRKRKEQYIIALLLFKDKNLQQTVINTVTSSTFKDIGLRKLYEYIINLSKEYDINKIDILAKTTDDEIIKELVDVMYIDTSSIDRTKLLKDILVNIKKDNYIQRRAEILERINEDISKDEKDILQAELSQILIEMNKLK